MYIILCAQHDPGQWKVSNQLDPTTDPTTDPTCRCDMGPVMGKCRRQIFPCSKMAQPWHVILVAGPPAAGRLGRNL